MADFVKVANTKDIPVNSIKPFRINGVPVAIASITTVPNDSLTEERIKTSDVL